MDELKRSSDFERLIRIDENVKAIKCTLDKYPLPKLNEQIESTQKQVIINSKSIDGHIGKHWQFWTAASAPALAALVVLAIEIFKGK